MLFIKMLGPFILIALCVIAVPIVRAIKMRAIKNRIRNTTKRKKKEILRRINQEIQDKKAEIENHKFESAVRQTLQQHGYLNSSEESKEELTEALLQFTNDFCGIRDAQFGVTIIGKYLLEGINICETAFKKGAGARKLDKISRDFKK